MPTIEEQHLLLLKDKYYYLNIPENTSTTRYYNYFEVLVPAHDFMKGNAHDFNIYFMNKDVTYISDMATRREVSDYIELTLAELSTSGKTIIWSSNIESYYSDSGSDVYCGPNNYAYIYVKDIPYIVFSVMVLPELNYARHVSDGKSQSSVIIFINGRQVTKPSAIGNFYNDDSNIAQIVVYNPFSFCIWNTDYERFVYKDLAQMCYREHSKNITTLETNKTRSYLKHPVLDGCFKHISENISAKLVAPYSIGSDVIKFSSTTSLSNGFILYKVYKVIKQSYDTLTMQISLVDLVDDSYNVFNDLYASDYSNLGNLESIQEQIVRTAVYNITSNEQYIVFYIRVVNGQPMIGYGSTLDIGTNFSSTQETVQLSSSKSYTLLIHPQSYSSTNKVNTEKLVQIEDISYSGNIPYPTDITTEEKNSLFMSPNNYHWKSLWKYNRTIEYSSPLQDNPVILPLNVFTSDENENMFVEFIINSGSINHFGIDLFDTCNIEQDGTDINVTPSGALFPVNGVSNVYYEGTVRLNVVSNSESVYFSQDTQGTTYPVAICFYYNSKTKKLLVERSDETSSKEITEISKDVLRNISCHIPGTGSITINFGPTSDYFQDYIDEILDQDNKPTQEIQIINKNIVKDLQFYNISDIIGGGAVTPTPDPTYTYAAIPSGTLITVEDYNTRLDEIKEETLRIYCSHEYSNNNSVIYISNNDNFDMRSPVNILSIQAVRAKATATFTLPPDPNLETYMNTILEKYVEGFYTYNVTIDCGSQRVIDGATRARVDEFKIQKINENQFELIMVCDYVASNNYLTFQKDHSYQFDSFSTISYSYSDFGEDIYLTLMKSAVTTKLEFTIIGDYNGGGQ